MAPRKVQCCGRSISLCVTVTVDNGRKPHGIGEERSKGGEPSAALPHLAVRTLARLKAYWAPDMIDLGGQHDSTVLGSRHDAKASVSWTKATQVPEYDRQQGQLRGLVPFQSRENSLLEQLTKLNGILLDMNDAIKQLKSLEGPKRVCRHNSNTLRRTRVLGGILETCQELARTAVAIQLGHHHTSRRRAAPKQCQTRQQCPTRFLPSPWVPRQVSHLWLGGVLIGTHVGKAELASFPSWLQAVFLLAMLGAENRAVDPVWGTVELP